MKRIATVVAVLAILPVVLTLTGCTTPPGTPADYSLVQYPGAGFSGLYAQTAAAKKSIDMEMYELSDQTEERALVAARRRGVTVRVLLNSAYEGKQANQAAYDELRSGGVEVRWARSDTIFHAKVTTFDRTTSDISTANLTSRYYSTTRDAEIIDTDAAQVSAIEQTFANDWAGDQPASDEANTPGLVWSPDAESTMVGQITSATSSIDFTSEELSDPYVYRALAADAQRGVRCRVVMMDEADWATAFAAISAAGCLVHVFPDTPTGFYVHEKAIVDDAGTSHASVMIGSQNASYSSLAFNRELSIVLTESQAPDEIAAMADVFDTDFAAAATWRG